MNLRELLGDAYHDGMTVEEISQALENVNTVVSKRVFDETASELAKMKKAVKEKDKQSEAQKTEMEQLQTELQEELKSARLARSKANAEAAFTKAGIDDALSVVNGLITDDVEATDERVKAVVELLSRHGKAVEQKAKEDLIKGSSKPEGVGGNAPAMTAEQFLQLDPIARMEFSTKSPELYEKLTNEIMHRR